MNSVPYRDEFGVAQFLRRGPIRIVIAVLIVAVVGGVVLTRIWTTSPSPPPPAPSCSTDSNARVAIQALGESASTQQVLQLAAAGAADPAQVECPETRAALVSEAYLKTYAGLWAAPHVRGDLAGGRDAADRWALIEAFATEQHIPLDRRRSALETFHDAYAASFFELARAAFDAAVERGEVRLNDPRLLQVYYATLRNLGTESVEAGSVRDRQQGIRMLRTACLIAEHANLGGEACQDLEGLVGLDRSTWPPSLPDLVLDQLTN